MAVFKIYTEGAVFQSFETLKTNRNKRHRRRAFFVEGVQNINAAARYGWHFEAFIVADGGVEIGTSTKLSNWAQGMMATHRGVDVYELAPELMQKLSAKTDASELAAIVRMRDGAGGSGDGAGMGGSGDGAGMGGNGDSAGGSIFVLSDRPSGKGNLGTLMRSCDAFGVKALYRTGHSVDFYDPEVVSASMGSFFAVPFYTISTSDALESLICGLKQAHPNLLVVGTSAHGDTSIYEIDLSEPLLLLIGNEADGLSWRLKQAADVMAAIPMSGGAFATSLNVSCAATALLYEACRQRAGASRPTKA
ncbi:MAG: hypothetical protein FWH01_09720 [Oscillospiraceae bacterium]|nr:hypothetical protein [Oscillospiraceae bacterium]